MPAAIASTKAIVLAAAMPSSSYAFIADGSMENTRCIDDARYGLPTRSPIPSSPEGRHLCRGRTTQLQWTP